MKEFIPLLSALVGGIIGFFASFIANWQSNKFQVQSEQVTFKRKKREELYFVVAKLRQQYRNLMGNCILKVTHDKKIEFDETGDINTWDELSMIVNLYFPELKISVKKLITERDKVGEILAETISFKSSSKTDIQKLNGKIEINFTSINKKFLKFQEEISNIKQ